MIPQEFYKLYKQRCSLYITDFNTEVYDLTSQASSYRIDINAIENYSNYTYHYKIFPDFITFLRQHIAENENQ